MRQKHCKIKYSMKIRKTCRTRSSSGRLPFAMFYKAMCYLSQMQFTPYMAEQQEKEDKDMTQKKKVIMKNI